MPNYIAHPQFPHTAHDNFYEERQRCPIQKDIQPRPNVPSYSQQTSPQPTDDGRLVYYCSPVPRAMVATTGTQLLQQYAAVVFIAKFLVLIQATND